MTKLENMVESMHAQIECLKERVLILEQQLLEQAKREQNK
jgi:hypothetical protein|tara:strand:- start:676 stop:795 length:120 start_codon:yes stop_codon:yes gene_type:complete